MDLREPLNSKKTLSRKRMELPETFQDVLGTERVFADLRSSWDFLELLWTSF